MVSNRQVGYGLVFGVPKSLSIYLAITGDQVVENIARSTVDETMRAMESEMQCKVRKAGAEDHAVKVLRRLDLGREACRDLLHYPPSRVIGFHTRTAGGFRPGEKWTVRETNCQTVTLERDGKIRHFKPSAKGKWDVLVSSAMQVSVGDQIRVTGGFREGKNAFKNNDIAEG